MSEPVVWGTGYGSKRHLVRLGSRKTEPTSRYGRQRYALSDCSSTIYLSFFSDAEGGEDVMKKPACPRCARKASQKVCPTCDGAGVVDS